MGINPNQTEPKPAFHWTAQRNKAALLLAENDLSDREIASHLRMSRTTLHTWKQHPDFAAQVGDHIGQVQAAMLRLMIAKKHKRLEVLDRLHEKYLTVIAERGEQMAGEDAGTGTGVVARQVKQIGTGERAITVTEYVTDTGIAKEIRDLHKQAAQELGQWVERGELSGPGGEPLIIRSISVPLPVREGDGA